MAIEEAELGIEKKARINEIIRRVTQVDIEGSETFNQTDLVRYSFICARLYKMSSPQGADRAALHRSIENVSFAVDMSSMTNEDVSQYLWSCAIGHVEPFIPHNLKLGVLPPKQFCTIIWALSQWASPGDDPKFRLFKDLIGSITDDISGDFSSKDLTALTRAIAVVHSR